MIKNIKIKIDYKNKIKKSYYKNKNINNSIIILWYLINKFYIIILSI